MKALIFIFLCLLFAELRAQEKAITIVVLGSSTAFGTGASPRENGWVFQYENYLHAQNPDHTIHNLAWGGYTSYKIMPDEFRRAGRPNPDPERNITKALSYNPDAIIINLPSNDITNFFPLPEFTANLDSVKSMANNAGVVCFISTTQPRNEEIHERDQLIFMKDTILNRYQEFSIDFWSGIAITEEENESARGEIKDAYNFGDGIHLNNAGHTLLAERTIDKEILEYLNPLPIILGYFEIFQISENGIELIWGTNSESNNDYFSVERGENGIFFTEIDRVKSKGNGNSIQRYTFIDKPPKAGILYYRLKQIDVDGKFAYSRIVQAPYLVIPDRPYPNPTRGILNLPIEDTYSLIIYDSKGTKVFNRKNLKENILDLRNYSKGIYTLQYIIQNKSKQVRIILN